MSDFTMSHHASKDDLIKAQAARIAELEATLASDCSRSHPHENMSPMCELRTEIARLTNELAHTKAQLAAAQQGVQPVAWAAVYFGGKRAGKIYTTLETEQQCLDYIAQVHQSNDSITLTAKPVYTHPTTQGLDVQTLEALEEAESALNSINMGKQHKIVQADGEVTYWQREEWCKWAKDQVLPKVTAALEAQAKQGGQ